MRDSFEPHEMATLVRVIDKACAELGTCNEATRSMIAERIIAYASQGQTDPDVLLSVALNGHERVRHAA